MTLSDAQQERKDLIAAGRYVVCANYHATPRTKLRDYRDDFKYFKENFYSVQYEDFERLAAGEPWWKDKPGLMINIFEGYRAHYDVMLPLLDEIDFTGFFYIIPGYIESKTDAAIIADYHYIREVKDEYSDGRIALSWEETAEIGENHVLVNHSYSHFIPYDSCGEGTLHDEIIFSRELVEKRIGKAVNVFCWLGGISWGKYPAADEMIKTAGYEYLVSNDKVERVC